MTNPSNFSETKHLFGSETGSHSRNPTSSSITLSDTHTSSSLRMRALLAGDKFRDGYMWNAMFDKDRFTVRPGPRSQVMTPRGTWPSSSTAGPGSRTSPGPGSRTSPGPGSRTSPGPGSRTSPGPGSRLAADLVLRRESAVDGPGSQQLSHSTTTAPFPPSAAPRVEPRSDQPLFKLSPNQLTVSPVTSKHE